MSERSPSGRADVEVQGAATVAVVRRPRQATKVARSLVRGQTVAGRFRVLRFINSGGMGEVFEAWDSELGERVALKTIRSEVASLSPVIERFKQEVRQSRAISHINVCRVYEVFSHVQDSGERVWFLTMELLEGQTLAERLRQQGPIPAGEALGLVEQMVAGLAAAHELGVVHRDFKSSNVMLVDARLGKTRAVITDFGLALKVLTGKHADPEEAKQGTPRYMSPEQVQGGEVGFAADQYALGVVVCEMLTGESPRRADAGAGAGAAILPAGQSLSPRWQSVIRRCLEFRPEDRFPQIGDVAVALNPVRRSSAWAVGGAASLALMVGLLLFGWLRRGDLRLEEVAQLTPSTDYSGQPSLSRDGRVVAYSSDRAEAGKLDIWLQHVPVGTPIRLTSDPAEDVDPNISPDGKSVVFRSLQDGGGIYIVDARGGSERLLVPGGRDARFSPDARSIAYWIGDLDRTLPTGEIFLMSLRDGSSRRIVPEFKDARFPIWSVDGQYLLFSGCREGDQPLHDCSDWWVTKRDGTFVRNTGAVALLRRQQVEPVEAIASWSQGVAIFAARYGKTVSLWQLKIPEKTMAATGAARQLASRSAWSIDEVSLAESGEVAFSQLSAAVHIWLVGAASAGDTATKVTQDASYDFSPFVSHNGRWLVFCRGVGTHHDIWIRDMRTGQEAVLVGSAQDKASPIVNDSGDTVVFEASDERSGASLLVAGRDQPARVLCTGCTRATDWFDGNRAVFYQEGLPSTIKLANLETGEKSTVLTANQVSLSEANWSPQNQYVLFTASSPGGAKRIFAVRLPAASGRAAGDWIPITEEAVFADRGRWSGDGKTVFYLSRRDGWPCLWGQRFDPQGGRILGPPFPVIHLHNPRNSVEMIAPDQFQVSVAEDYVYFNLGEASATIWTGRIKPANFFSRFTP